MGSRKEICLKFIVSERFQCFSLLLRPTNRRETESKVSVVESNEARQKFAGAKAISSDMFFGREVDAEVGFL